MERKERMRSESENEWERNIWRKSKESDLYNKSSFADPDLSVTIAAVVSGIFTSVDDTGDPEQNTSRDEQKWAAKTSSAVACELNVS